MPLPSGTVPKPYREEEHKQGLQISLSWGLDSAEARMTESHEGKHQRRRNLATKRKDRG